MTYVSAFSAFIFFLTLSLPNMACCTAWRQGDKPVRIADQEVLLIWDAEKGVEHFVRRASFQSESASEDFGFLVPTPTQPKLREVPDRVFDDLGGVIKPKVEVKNETKFSFTPLILLPISATAGKSSMDVAALSEGVQVLDTAIVGGFEVAVLRASESGALITWLDENGYDARPEIRDWVMPYVEKKWIITAFKYMGKVDRGPAALARASVCLSFETDAPFFPYRVPKDTRVEPQDGSLLRLYFAGRERMQGGFENGGDQEWSASTKFSDRDEGMADILQTALGDFVDDSRFSNLTWLTAFEDETWPGGAEDLYFKPSQSQQAITPAVIKRAKIKMIRLPLDLVLLGVLLIAYLYRKRLKRSAA